MAVERNELSAQLALLADEFVCTVSIIFWPFFPTSILSILAPLLFLIYINDFTQSSDFFSMRLFADDTSLTASAKNIDELLLKINKELPNIYDWLCANKLTLNLRKTKYLIFQPRQKVDYILLPPLSIGGQCLGTVQ